MVNVLSPKNVLQSHPRSKRFELRKAENDKIRRYYSEVSSIVRAVIDQTANLVFIQAGIFYLQFHEGYILDVL